MDSQNTPPPKQIVTDYSYVRFLNTVPTAPMDMYANNDLVMSSLSYGVISNYYPFFPGNVTFTGILVETNEMVGFATFTLPPNSAYTNAGIGIYPNSLQIIQQTDPYPPTTAKTISFLRFVNLSSDVPPVNVLYKNGIILFQTIAYKENSYYIRMLPGNYTLSFTSAASGAPLFSDLKINLSPNIQYSLYAIGHNTDSTKHSVILTPDSLY